MLEEKEDIQKEDTSLQANDAKEETISEVIEDTSKTIEEEVNTPKATTEEIAQPEIVKEEESAPLETSSLHIEVAKSKEEEEVLEEIGENNAEDAEDKDNERRHVITLLDYHAMTMENLVGELQRLVKNEKAQAIKKHVDGIKHEFDLKFQEFLEHKKEEFIANGGNEIDFHYNSVTKRQFNEVFGEYREKRDQYYKNLEKSLKDNLTIKLGLIDELKGLMNVEEDINSTYNHFKKIQESWRNTGPVPRGNYNDVWRTYHHHTERFYDFLHLNRELRDLDFKHNLVEKLKIVVRAEELTTEPDLNKAFREIQLLHKIWKEDIGPVGKDHREEVWGRFSVATKELHRRRQEYFKDLEKSYEGNLEIKNKIIEDISTIANSVSNNHRGLQQQVKNIEAYRDLFFRAGKVPQAVNEDTWSRFKEAVRSFNRNKNAYYKSLKKEQQENLDKKRTLLDKANVLKESDDWETVTPQMKRIQSDWKNIGHVPRKYSDKIWNEFKTACNHYFDRLHALKNETQKEESANFDLKNDLLERLKTFQLTGEKGKDLENIQAFIKEWKSIGNVPYNKRNINSKFNKIIDALFKKLDINQQQAEILKYGDKLQELVDSGDERGLNNERVFIRRKIDESHSEIRQLENNLQFFSNASENNPLFKDVVKNIEKQKHSLEHWKSKLQRIKTLVNQREKAKIAAEQASNTEEE